MSILGALRYPVQWHEGMLLMPQHFQQTDRRMEQYLHWGLRATLPHPWGVLTHHIDPGALAGGVFRLTMVEAIMPDGLYVQMGSDGAPGLELDLENAKELFQGKKRLFVYLTVPSYKPNDVNVGRPTDRFLSWETSPSVDENTGDDTPPFPILKPNLALFIGDKAPSGLSSLPLAEVAYSGHAYHLTSYVPPCFHVVEKTFLYDTCQTLARRIREKFGFLTMRLHEGTAELMSYEGENAVQSLTAGLLPFEAMALSGAVAPFQLYLGLVTLASQLSALDSALMPPVFDPYRHDDLLASFGPVLTYIDLLLDRIQEGYRILPFDQSNRLFHLYLNHGWIQKRMVLGAKASPTMTEKELINWIQTAVICSERLVSSVRDRRILGTPRQLIAGDEALKLLPARDVVLFTIEGESEFVQKDEVLHIFNVGDTDDKRPSEVVFYLPNGDPSSTGGK